MPLAVFDLDHTLLKTNCSLEFGRYLFRERLISFRQATSSLFHYLSHRLFHFPTVKLHLIIFRRIFHGWDLDTLDHHVTRFLDERLDAMLAPPVMHRLREYQKSQHPLVLLSNSPDFLVRPIAKRLGIEEWWSTSYAVDNEGRLSHIAYFVEGADKAVYVSKRAAELGISPADVWVVTDHLLDLPLLYMAGRCTVVRPSRKLYKIARLQGWEVLDYDS